MPPERRRIGVNHANRPHSTSNGNRWEPRQAAQLPDGVVMRDLRQKKRLEKKRAAD
jgi:hypothetical protein